MNHFMGYALTEIMNKCIIALTFPIIKQMQRLMYLTVFNTNFKVPCTFTWVSRTDTTRVLVIGLGNKI